MMSYFFRSNYESNVRNVIVPKFEWIRIFYRRDILKLFTYYYHRIRPVNNTNFFTRLIKTMYQEEDDINVFYEDLVARTRSSSRFFEITSNTAEGKVHHDVFYNGDLVMMLDTSSHCNLEDLRYKHPTNSPIRVVYSDETDLDFYQLDLKKNMSHTMVIEIDIHKLLLFYREWNRIQTQENRDTDINRFVYQDLYPRIALQHIDIIMFNRLRYLFEDKKLNQEYKLRHPIPFINYTKGVDDILIRTIKTFHNTESHLDVIMENVPVIYNKNLLNVLRFSNKYNYNKQSEWVYWVARLKYITFFLKFLGQKGIQRNLSVINQLPAQIRQLRNRSTSAIERLPYRLAVLVKEHMEYIDRNVGR